MEQRRKWADERELREGGDARVASRRELLMLLLLLLMLLLLWLLQPGWDRRRIGRQMNLRGLMLQVLQQKLMLLMLDHCARTAVSPRQRIWKSQREDSGIAA